MDLAEGFLLDGRFRVLRVLGEGGMSKVYLVEDERLPGRQWAMKEMAPGGSAEDCLEMEEQFRKEAEILCRLDHPSLPRVSAFFSERGRHYLVMEYIQGRTLYDILEGTAGFIEEPTLLDWGVQLCDTLTYLHGQAPPIIYRDIKPRNVILAPDGRLKLIDFGIARLFGSQKTSDTIIIGTPGFASPEQYGRGQTDARSDIYSLGATLYNLATRLDPADRPFCFSVPSTIHSGLSNAFDNAILKALNLKPEDRFPTAAEFRDALLSRQTTVLPYISTPSEGSLSLDIEPSHLVFHLAHRGQPAEGTLRITNRGGRFLKARVTSNRSWLRVEPSVFEENHKILAVMADVSREKKDRKYRGNLIIETDERSFPVMVTINIEPTIWDTVIPRSFVSGFLMGQALVPMVGPFTIPYTYTLFDGEEKRVQKKWTVASVTTAILTTLHFVGFI